MAWIALTEADVLRKLAAPELEAARTAAIANGQADPLPDVISEVVREVRGRIAANTENQIGAAGTIADECEGAALARIRFELATRLPGGSLLDDDRRQANKDAIAYLRDVAAGTVKIDQPTTVTTETIGGGAVEVISTTTRVSTRDKLKGL